MGEFIKENLPYPRDYFAGQGLPIQGRGRWVSTRCVFHGGSDSLRIDTHSGGFICMACGVKGGDVLSYHMQSHDLEFVDAAQALGAWHNDGKPDKPYKPKPLSATDALRVLAFESMLVCITAGNIANGVQLSNIDLARLLAAHKRIATITEAFA